MFKLMNLLITYHLKLTKTSKRRMSSSNNQLQNTQIQRQMVILQPLLSLMIKSYKIPMSTAMDIGSDINQMNIK